MGLEGSDIPVTHKTIRPRIISHAPTKARRGCLYEPIDSPDAHKGNEVGHAGGYAGQGSPPPKR
jgi:hypothetical protein